MPLHTHAHTHTQRKMMFQTYSFRVNLIRLNATISEGTQSRLVETSPPLESPWLIRGVRENSTSEITRTIEYFESWLRNRAQIPYHGTMEDLSRSKTLSKFTVFLFFSFLFFERTKYIWFSGKRIGRVHHGLNRNFGSVSRNDLITREGGKSGKGESKGEGRNTGRAF